MIKGYIGTKRFCFEKIKHWLVAYQNSLMFRVLLWRYREGLNKIRLIRLGSLYGGWWIPVDAEINNENRVLVSAGLGFDTSFDEAMLERGWSVLGIDPLSVCCEFAKKELARFSNFRILNSGLSVEDGFQRFFQPKNPSHDSWSTINAQAVELPLSKNFPVVSLRSVIENYEIVQAAQYKYLKMDIEGAELALLQESLKDIREFDFLAVELDFLALIPFRHLKLRLHRLKIMREILCKLKNDGWHLVHVENSNFFWEAS